MTRHRFVLFLVVALALVACSDDSGQPAGPSPLPEGAVPAFALTDANPNSSSADQEVSPRDHVDRISAWYFGHST